MKKIGIASFILFSTFAGVKIYAGESEFKQAVLALQSVNVTDDGQLEMRARYPDRTIESLMFDGEVGSYRFFVSPCAIIVKINDRFSGTAVYINYWKEEWWRSLSEFNEEVSPVNFVTIIVQTEHELEKWEEFVQLSKQTYVEHHGSGTNFKKAIPLTRN